MSDRGFSFQAVLNQTVQMMLDLDGVEIALPQAFAYRESAQRQLVLVSRFFKLNSIGEFRGVSIVSPKVAIVAQFLFPEPEQDLPVYAMEFVAIGGKPVVGMMDLKAMLSASAAARDATSILTGAHRQFPDVKYAEDAPDWYRACCSGLDFFVRPNQLSDFLVLSEIHRYILEGLTASINSAKQIDRTDQAIHSTALRDYKYHHRINAPGIPLMHRTFGERWTADFMEGYLYA